MSVAYAAIFRARDFVFLDRFNTFSFRFAQTKIYCLHLCIDDAICSVFVCLCEWVFFVYRTHRINFVFRVLLLFFFAYAFILFIIFVIFLRGWNFASHKYCPKKNTLTNFPFTIVFQWTSATLFFRITIAAF